MRTIDHNLLKAAARSLAIGAAGAVVSEKAGDRLSVRRLSPGILCGEPVLLGRKAMLELVASPDAGRPEDLAAAPLEAPIHAILPHRFVFSTATDRTLALVRSRRGRAQFSTMGFPRARWIPCDAPGLPAARATARELGREGGQPPDILVLPAHGVFIGTPSAGALERRMGEFFGSVVRRLARATGRALLRWVDVAARRRAEPPEGWEDLAAVAVPSVRGSLSEVRNVVLPVRHDLVSGPRAGTLARGAAPAPWHALVCGAPYLVVSIRKDDGPAPWSAAFARGIAGYREKHGRDPSVIVVPGWGVLCIGRSLRHAAYVRDLALESLTAAALSLGLGGVRPIAAADPPSWASDQLAAAIDATVPRGRVAGRIAIVTGGAQGVGRQICEALAGEGALVTVCDVNAQGAEQAAAEISAARGEACAIGLAGDVTDEGAMRAVARETLKRFGGLDLLISNAGILKAFKITEFPAQVWRAIIDVNMVGTFVCAKVAAEVMRHDRGGDIIQINSKSGKKGSKYNSAYAASKFGGIGLVQSIALDLIEDRIKVNAICPGNFFDLPLWSAPGGLFDQYRAKYPGSTRDDVRRIYEGQVPMGRGCAVADVMKTIYYILEQGYETGQAYNVTGGQEMR